MDITTRNLHLHTAQEVFDFVCSKVIQQGRASKSGTACAYRGSDGDRCAFGHVIHDDDYARLFPYNEPSSLGLSGLTGRLHPRVFGHWQPGADGEPYAHFELLKALQLDHDVAGTRDFVGDFKAGAARTALEFKLNTNVLWSPT